MQLSCVYYSSLLYPEALAQDVCFWYLFTKSNRISAVEQIKDFTVVSL
jgi:hypothetical protein